MASKLEIDLGLLDDDLRAVAIRYRGLLRELQLLSKYWAAEQRDPACVNSLLAILEEYQSTLKGAPSMEMDAGQIQNAANNEDLDETSNSTADWFWEGTTTLPNAKLLSYAAYLFTCSSKIYKLPFIVQEKTKFEYKETGIKFEHKEMGMREISYVTRELTALPNLLNIGDAYAGVKIAALVEVATTEDDQNKILLSECILGTIKFNTSCREIKLSIEEDLISNEFIIKNLVMK